MRNENLEQRIGEKEFTRYQAMDLVGDIMAFSACGAYLLMSATGEITENNANVIEITSSIIFTLGYTTHLAGRILNAYDSLRKAINQ